MEFLLEHVLLLEKPNLLKPGSHGSTFGGNYLSTSVGLQVLDIMRDMNLCRNAREMGDYFSKKLNERLANKKSERN